MGRFVCADYVDYLGFDGSVSSFNLFSYCKNNPTLYLDKLGTNPVVPPMVENGLNLPPQGGIPVVVNGVTYYYAIGYSPSDELYEYWFDSQGNLIRARHHSTHGNEKEHKSPHDHEGTKGKKGKNSIKKERLPVDEKFKSPQESLEIQKSTASEIFNKATAGIIIGFVSYQIVKWGIAYALAPWSGGTSLMIAFAA